MAGKPKKSVAGAGRAAVGRAVRLAASTADPRLLDDYNRLKDESERRTLALASAAHELKTPLSIMNGYVGLLLSEKLGPLNERQREMLADMRDSGVRLQHFIGDFLTYSAMETGNLRLQPAPADLGACIDEICDFWLPRFREKGVALYATSHAPMEPLHFDYHKVQQVVSNLLDNALKFTPRGGSVWVSMEPWVWERRSASGEATKRNERRRRNLPVPNAVRVTVGDTGVGIAPEYHQEIFEDFVKLSQESSSGGIGLGLAISRRLVSAHGGKIWVESTPGVGSKFSFLLPAPPAADGTAAGDVPVAGGA
jgi:signal transduction histidine kinase